MGTILAVVSVLCYNAGYLLEKGALDAMPPLGRPSAAWARVLASSPRWVAGFTVMIVGLVLRLGALTLAPVSVVQPVLAGGTVALVLLARVVLGERLTRGEQAAVGLLLAGVAAVAVSTGAERRHATGDVPALLVMAAVTAAVWAWGSGGRSGAGDRSLHRAGTVVAIGLCYGTGAVGEKGVAVEIVRQGLVHGCVASLATIWPWAFVVATAAGLVLFQVALQRLPASLLVPASNGTSSLYALIGAVVVFGDPWSPGGWRVVPLVAGYALLLTGLLLLVAGAGRAAALPGRTELAPPVDGPAVA